MLVGGFVVAVRRFARQFQPDKIENPFSSSLWYLCLLEERYGRLSFENYTQIYVNEVVLGTAFGIFMGPYFAGIFDPRDWTTHSETVTLEVMRIVLATGLFAIGVELPKSYMARHAKSLLAMVVPTMAIGWVIVAGKMPLVLFLDMPLTPNVNP
jgi:Sodium/hydrogen exchanger family